MAKISIYTLGQSGVVLDNQTFNPTSSDDSLTTAQNATNDATNARAGALVKREGLRQFNQLWAGGVVLGGIPMAVAGTGGAPAVAPGSAFPGFTGSTPTGNPAGSGNGTGAPGTPWSGSATYGTTSPTLFNGGTTIFGGARLIVMGRIDNTASNSGGSGWFVTSKQFADAAVSLATPGPPATVYSYPPTTTFPMAYGSPMVWQDSTGYLFYAKNHDQVAGTASTIYKTNGAANTLVCTIPTSGSTSAHVNDPSNLTIRSAVVGMTLGSDGHIYIGMKEKADGQSTSGNYGYVWQMDPATGNLTSITKAIPPAAGGYGGIPYCLAYFNGSVYWGEHNLASSDTQLGPGSAAVYATSTDLATFQVEHGFSDGNAFISFLYPFPQTAPASNPSMNLAANQVLFLGNGCNKGSPNYSFIYSRDRSAPTTSSAYTAQQVGTGSGAVNGNYFVSAVAFKDNLYASFLNPGDNAVIFKFVPDYTNLAADGGWSGAGTWSTAYTNGGGGRVPYWLFVDDNILYAVGQDNGANRRSALSTTDGASWSDGTTNALPTFSNASFPLPVFFGVAQ